MKIAHASAVARKESEGISIKQGDEIYSFNTNDIDEIVEARLEEIFELVQKELKKAGRAGQLPSGVVLTGGTANIKRIAEYAKDQLGLAVRVGKAGGFGGVADNIDTPELATAVGLMLIDAEGASQATKPGGKPHAAGKQTIKQAGGLLKNIFGRFKA